MVKVDLLKASGLPLYLENGQLFGFTQINAQRQNFQINEVRKQLLNSDVECSDTIFSKYSNLFPEYLKKVSINAYLITPFLAGIEYSKTNAFVSTQNSIYEVIHGGGVLIMQDFNSSEEGKVFYTVLKKGSKFVIPSGYEFSFSNTKSLPLIVLEFTQNSKSICNCLDDMKGMSYYVIRKNAKYEIVKNPSYKFVGDAMKLGFEKPLKSLGISPKTPIYKQLSKNYEKIISNFKSDSFSL